MTQTQLATRIIFSNYSQSTCARNFVIIICELCSLVGLFFSPLPPEGFSDCKAHRVIVIWDFSDFDDYDLLLLFMF